MQEKQLTLGSLFDGIGGFPLAAVISGITPVWASEIEPFCIAVTKERFPNMLHLGSVTNINGAEIPPVDIITFGSPCQDLSVAGQRAGLDGEQSGLFKEAVRIIYEMRSATNGKYPKYIVWENVPGAFSSNKGNDFKTVLEEITKTHIPMPSSGKWSNAGMVRSSGITAAWRLLDAQYWGVPQRRKRIYLVGSFGSDNAVEILFKCDSVQRYLTPCGAEGKAIATRTRNGIETANKIYDARGNGNGDIAPTITGDHCGHMNDYAAIVLENTDVFCLQGNMIGREDKNGPQGSGVNENVSFTVNTIDRHAVVYALDHASFNQDINAQYDFEISDNGINSTIVAKGPSAVGYNIKTFSNVASTLRAGAGAPKHEADFVGRLVAQWCKQKIMWIIRRLTPLECERLQGYPDFWTCLPSVNYIDEPEFSFWQKVIKLHKEINNKKPTIPLTPNAMAKWYNKLENDGNKYKALGNSLAIPCALRVIGYIADYERNLNNE